MKVNLLKALVYADNLSYSQAQDLLTQAQNSPAGTTMVFFLHGAGVQDAGRYVPDSPEGKWCLMGRPIASIKDFDLYTLETKE